MEKKMMKKKTVLLLTILMIAFSLGSLFASAPAAKQVYLKALSQLDRLEGKYPCEQSEIFKLRIEIDQLYHISDGVSCTDPVDANGNLKTPDLSAGGDLYAPCKGLTNDALKAALSKIVSVQVPVGYQRAQDIVFGKLDNFNGKVEGVYTGRVIETVGEPDARNMNIEHTWPQSQGATGIAKCDLHHLFPTDSKANGIRGHLPFGNVKNPTWQSGGSSTDKHVFEVRMKQRGDTARAKFYFAIRYHKKIGAAEEKTLREWSKEDPVSDYERKRNDRIENFQHNRNPFVDHPEFIDRIQDF